MQWIYSSLLYMYANALVLIVKTHEYLQMPWQAVNTAKPANALIFTYFISTTLWAV